MQIDERVEALRGQMRKAGLCAYIINSTDPHESEYVSDRWRAVRWISGFTGEAATCVVTMDKALIWVDSRFFIQCADQIRGTVFEMRKLNGPEASSPIEYLRETFYKGGKADISGNADTSGKAGSPDKASSSCKVGISAETLMVDSRNSYLKNHIDIQPTEDLLDAIWEDRPPMPRNPVEKLDDALCGLSAEEKISQLREKGRVSGEDYQMISSLDDIAWILNLRGGDIEDTPVFLAHLLIGPDKVQLFTPKERFTDVKPVGYEVLPYEAVTDELSKLKDVTVRINPSRINMRVFNALAGVRLSEGREYSTDLKACKNESELEGIRTAHILDGVAMVNFLAQVKGRRQRYTELSIAEALGEERGMEEDYLGPSFTTIAGFREHGAIVHYTVTPETDIPVSGNGLLVLDSGGQYTCGTTDITRTILFGRSTKEQRRDYTLVLKGHLALASLIFPEGTTGHQIDALAHQFLWEYGMDFFHGTGHGVGFRLAVHEGPQSISYRQNPSAPVPLREGMVVSDEPGVYKEGRYGIRIENLIAVVKDRKTEFGQFLAFETLTCCPYERALIDKDLLTQQEIDMVNDYHDWVHDTLIDMVDESAVSYLKEATRPL